MAATVLDEDLADGLRQAKKSPRNFALIMKGPKPVKLIVQKKPIRDGELMKAKTEFKGNDIISGVVQGQGAEHVFLVVGAEPSVKIVALKDYISEQTELTVKPRFEVVTEVPSVEGGEDGAATTAAFSIVKLGKTRIEWQTTRDTAGADMRKLKTVIAAEFSDDAAQKAQLDAALKKLDSLIAEVENDLHEQLDKILNADEEARKPLIAAAKASIGRLNKTLDDPVMSEIDDNEFTPGLYVVEPLRTKLEQISAALG